jgi:gas vesicle protein
MSNENNNRQFGAFITGMLVGGLAGATVAILKAPMSGEEAREQIRAKGVEWQNTAEQTLDEAVASVRTSARDLSDRAEVILAQSQAAIEEAQKQQAQAIEEIKKTATEAIAETKDAAVEAGKETT